MSNKVKGLLKGLRYISQIFEEEEEPEMQIGCPTDVKHVAHIGWDGPTANSPSWIQQFKDGEGPPNGDQQNAPATRDIRPPDQGKRGSTLEPSPSKRRSDKPKGAKRHSSAGSSNPDSPKRNSASSASDATATSSSKTTRRRKPKTSSKSKPTSTTPDSAYSDPVGDLTTPARVLKNKDTCQSSVITVSDVDQNALDDKAARRIRAM
ncbi:hypothetical protein RND81_12G134000 [Saponaria officinalis]|uniref:CRIB domain-containing protein n=1 Tax=Saponaria officinalis TaxID=3572 RepID=A0AAW1HA13_SAPOF